MGQPTNKALEPGICRFFVGKRSRLIDKVDQVLILSYSYSYSIRRNRFKSIVFLEER